MFWDCLPAPGPLTETALFMGIASAGVWVCGCLLPPLVRYAADVAFRARLNRDVRCCLAHTWYRVGRVPAGGGSAWTEVIACKECGDRWCSHNHR